MVIAVNGAVDHVRYDVALTMDGRFALNRWADLKGRQAFIRASAWEHAVNAGASPWDGLKIFNCDRVPTFSQRTPTDLLKLNGTNSGYCALNLAYVLRPRRVFLYGFDMGEPTHFFGNYPWHGQGSTNSREKFQTWAREMKEARAQFDAAGMQVFNTNPKTSIKYFEYGRPSA